MKRKFYFCKATTNLRRVVQWTVIPGRPYSENTVLISQGFRSVFGYRHKTRRQIAEERSRKDVKNSIVEPKGAEKYWNVSDQMMQKLLWVFSIPDTKTGQTEFVEIWKRYLGARSRCNAAGIGRDLPLCKGPKGLAENTEAERSTCKAISPQVQSTVNAEAGLEIKI